MSAEIAHELKHQQALEQGRPVTRSLRAHVILAAGWVVVFAGVAWAIAQPYRLTILHPSGHGFWWLVSEPPLYVVLAGLVFRRVVAKPLVEDLERRS
jgi:hypothetical protein